jgi:hypothetical protein
VIDGAVSSEPALSSVGGYQNFPLLNEEGYPDALAKGGVILDYCDAHSFNFSITFRLTSMTFTKSR